MDKCSKSANLYLATLRAMYLIHQHNHWTTKGNNYYGNHLLFQRIYEKNQESADLSAEKFIGVLGEDSVDFLMQNELINQILNKYKSLSKSPLQLSLKIEKEFLELSKETYDCFKEENKMTLGLDDMIMSLASNHEENVYLLQQALKGTSNMVTKESQKIFNRIKLFKKIAQENLNFEEIFNQLNSKLQTKLSVVLAHASQLSSIARGFATSVDFGMDEEKSIFVNITIKPTTSVKANKNLATAFAPIIDNICDWINNQTLDQKLTDGKPNPMFGKQVRLVMMLNQGEWDDIPLYDGKVHNFNPAYVGNGAEWTKQTGTSSPMKNKSEPTSSNSPVAIANLLNKIEKYAQDTEKSLVIDENTIASDQSVKKFLLKNVIESFSIIYGLGGGSVEVDSNSPPFDYKCSIKFINSNKLNEDIIKKINAKLAEIKMGFKNLKKEIDFTFKQ